jgi:outer membrane protein assembly factor BamD (BamD/ComL family)
MSKNIKITKREMKEDKFTTFMLQAKDYFLERWVYFAGGLVLVLAVIVGMNLIKSNLANREAEATEILSRARSELQGKNYQLAIVDYKSIVDDYSSTDHAQKALFELGNAYFAAKNFEPARTTYQEYLDKYQDDKYFTISAMAGIAACLAGGGDPAGAADKYREAAEAFPDFDLAGEYYLKAMQFYIKSGNLGSAKVMYATIIKDFEGTRFYTESQRIAGEHNIAL